MELLELIRVDFASCENYSPRYETSLGLFAENKEEHLSAHGVLGKYIETLIVNPYLGYDGNVYPQYKIREHIVKV